MYPIFQICFARHDVVLNVWMGRVWVIIDEQENDNKECLNSFPHLSFGIAQLAEMHERGEKLKGR